MDAKTFSTVADLFFGYDKMPRLNYKQIKLITDLFFLNFAIEKKPKLDTVGDSIKKKFKTNLKENQVKIFLEVFLSEEPVIKKS